MQALSRPSREWVERPHETPLEKRQFWTLGYLERGRRSEGGAHTWLSGHGGYGNHEIRRFP